MKAILNVLAKDKVKHGLKGYDSVKETLATNELFLMENGCLSPVMEVRM